LFAPGTDSVLPPGTTSRIQTEAQKPGLLQDTFTVVPMCTTVVLLSGANTLIGTNVGCAEGVADGDELGRVVGRVEGRWVVGS